MRQTVPGVRQTAPGMRQGSRGSIVPTGSLELYLRLQQTSWELDIRVMLVLDVNSDSGVLYLP